jgi:hypothetical protein
MVDNLSKFKKHIGRTVKFSLINEDGTEDEFEIKPMSVETFTEFMMISEKMDSLNKAEIPEKEQQRLMVHELFGMYKRVVRDSYPELDDQTAQDFVIQNFTVLIGFLNDIMPIKMSAEDKQSIMQKMNLIKDAK